MSKPRLLDLFCGAGGASMGYHRAGFEVVGVDIKPQPHYPFEFHQADALTYPLDGYDAYHASPPCQFHSAMSELGRAKGQPISHDKDYIRPIRERLLPQRKPYLIENVEGARKYLNEPVFFCGTMFNLGVIRHRLFEANFWLEHPYHTREMHKELQNSERYCCVVGMGGAWRKRNGSRQTDDWETAMGINWMERYELTQAIPPAYTEYIGKYLVQDVSKYSR